MATDEPDDESFRLAIQLQVAELEALTGRQKGKNREGEPLDLDIAIGLYKEELESYVQFVQDQRLCQSMVHAVRLDGAVISGHVQEEAQAQQDRRMAQRLGTGRTDPRAARPKGVERPTDALNEEALAKLEALYISPPPPEPEHEAESSSWAATRKHPDEWDDLKPKQQECISCRDRFEPKDVARCPCSHEYCRECLGDLFKASFTDESLFPPRCCKQEIPLEENKSFLPPKLVGEFAAKALEFSTPNRTYCHQPTCSTFIPPQFTKDDVGTCVRCQAKTCVTCKGETHANECPSDTATQELLRLAGENGWQRCYSCRRVVELSTGCNHITCPCRAEFCYVCGQRWKTCRCDRWDEHRLYDRACDVALRNAGPRTVGARRMQNLVETARRNLVEHHECTHRAWRNHKGEHRCEECGHTLPLFIYECIQCRIMACRRCRFNRL